jgi:hypothetical protein
LEEMQTGSQHSNL